MSDSNYDRGSLLLVMFRVNYLYSGDYSEGVMDLGLKVKLYECNDLDVVVFKFVEICFEVKKIEMMEIL